LSYIEKGGHGKLCGAPLYKPIPLLALKYESPITSTVPFERGPGLLEGFI